jgi:hypothetical protein
MAPRDGMMESRCTGGGGLLAFGGMLALVVIMGACTNTGEVLIGAVCGFLVMLLWLA